MSRKPALLLRDQALAASNGLLQRKCACGGTPGPTGECEECRNKRLSQAAHGVLESSGEPLVQDARTFMEQRLGHDFAKVRIHAGSEAAKSTTELMHVVQQASDVQGSEPTLEQSSEKEANRALSAGSPTKTPLLQGAPLWMPKLQRQADPSAGPVVYMCAKDLKTSPVGRHAFFRIGSEESGNPTYELEPQDNRPLGSVSGSKYGTGCWQGVPMQDFAEDKEWYRSGDCEPTPISLSCLQQEYASYPVGRYCTFGPNSNTFVGHIARRCGVSNPDPPGWTPGIDDDPPEPLTFAPSPGTTLTGCVSETGCVAVSSSTAPTGPDPAQASEAGKVSATNGQAA